MIFAPFTRVDHHLQSVFFRVAFLLNEMTKSYEWLCRTFRSWGEWWLTNRFEICKSWIPAFFMDVPLVEVLRTTSRSESSNSFFNRFILRKLSFIEFWLRFDMTLELNVDYIREHGTTLLSTPWSMDKQGSIVYTYEVFKNFNAEVIAARNHCSIVVIT
jgi:hypothetical protein